MGGMHSIDRIELDLVFGDPVFASDSDLASWVRTELLEAVDDVLCDHDDGSMLVLDRIELDLGEVDHKQARTEIVRRLRQRLDEALRGLGRRGADESRALREPAPDPYGSRGDDAYWSASEDELLARHARMDPMHLQVLLEALDAWHDRLRHPTVASVRFWRQVDTFAATQGKKRFPGSRLTEIGEIVRSFARSSPPEWLGLLQALDGSLSQAGSLRVSSSAVRIRDGRVGTSSLGALPEKDARLARDGWEKVPHFEPARGVPSVTPRMSESDKWDHSVMGGESRESTASPRSARIIEGSRKLDGPDPSGGVPSQEPARSQVSAGYRGEAVGAPAMDPPGSPIMEEVHTGSRIPLGISQESRSVREVASESGSVGIPADSIHERPWASDPQQDPKPMAIHGDPGSTGVHRGISEPWSAGSREVDLPDAEPQVVDPPHAETESGIVPENDSMTPVQCRVPDGAIPASEVVAGDLGSLGQTMRADRWEDQQEWIEHRLAPWLERIPLEMRKVFVEDLYRHARHVPDKATYARRVEEAFLAGDSVDLEEIAFRSMRNSDQLEIVSSNPSGSPSIGNRRGMDAPTASPQQVRETVGGEGWAKTRDSVGDAPPLWHRQDPAAMPHRDPSGSSGLDSRWLPSTESSLGDRWKEGSPDAKGERRDLNGENASPGDFHDSRYTADPRAAFSQTLSVAEEPQSREDTVVSRNLQPDPISKTDQQDSQEFHPGIGIPLAQAGVSGPMPMSMPTTSTRPSFSEVGRDGLEQRLAPWLEGIPQSARATLVESLRRSWELSQRKDVFVQLVEDAFRAGNLLDLDAFVERSRLLPGLDGGVSRSMQVDDPAPSLRRTEKEGLPASQGGMPLESHLSREGRPLASFSASAGEREENGSNPVLPDSRRFEDARELQVGSVSDPGRKTDVGDDRLLEPRSGGIDPVATSANVDQIAEEEGGIGQTAGGLAERQNQSKWIADSRFPSSMAPDVDELGSTLSDRLYGSLHRDPGAQAKHTPPSLLQGGSRDLVQGKRVDVRDGIDPSGDTSVSNDAEVQRRVQELSPSAAAPETDRRFANRHRGQPTEGIAATTPSPFSGPDAVAEPDALPAPAQAKGSFPEHEDYTGPDSPGSREDLPELRLARWIERISSADRAVFVERFHRICEQSSDRSAFVRMVEDAFRAGEMVDLEEIALCAGGILRSDAEKRTPVHMDAGAAGGTGEQSRVSSTFRERAGDVGIDSRSLPPAVGLGASSEESGRIAEGAIPQALTESVCAIAGVTESDMMRNEPDHSDGSAFNENRSADPGPMSTPESRRTHGPSSDAAMDYPLDLSVIGHDSDGFSSQERDLDAQRGPSPGSIPVPGSKGFGLGDGAPIEGVQPNFPSSRDAAPDRAKPGIGPNTQPLGMEPTRRSHQPDGMENQNMATEDTAEIQRHRGEANIAPPRTYVPETPSSLVNPVRATGDANASPSIPGKEQPTATMSNRLKELLASMDPESQERMSASIEGFRKRSRDPDRFVREVVLCLERKDLVDLEAILELADRMPVGVGAVTAIESMDPKSTLQPLAGGASPEAIRAQDPWDSMRSAPASTRPISPEDSFDSADSPSEARREASEAPTSPGTRQEMSVHASTVDLERIMDRDIPEVWEQAKQCADMVLSLAEKFLPWTESDRAKLLSRQVIHDRYAAAHRGYSHRDAAQELVIAFAKQYLSIDRTNLAAMVQRRLILPPFAAVRPQASEGGIAKAASAIREVLVSEGMAVGRAGIVIAAPYLPRLFKMLDLLRDDRFADEASQVRAMRLVRYAASGMDPDLDDLVMERALCGLASDVPLLPSDPLSERDRQLVDQMLGAILQNWSALGKTSVAGLRETFLVRPGWLKKTDEFWQIRVKNGTFDMLLDKLPWGISMVKHPWMELPMNVEWR